MRHPVDMSVVGLLKWGPESLRFFTEGWGDEEDLHPGRVDDVDVEPVDIRWLTRSNEGDVVVSHGVFQSPLGTLPHRATQGHVLGICPVDRDPERLVLLMPAWNEHDPKVRVALARHLAVLGIQSLLLENAYFGTRHPDPDGDHPIRTVGDFMLMGSSAVLEARALLAAAHRDGRDVGVAGYSMGANTAALVSATVPFAVATTPMAASHSPSPVFLDGVLRHGIAFDALGGEDRADELRSVLGRVSVLDYEPLPHHESAIVVGARSDAYIPAEATEALAAHWAGSDLR